MSANKPTVSHLSAEMNGLLEHKKHIQSWLKVVENRIWEAEETYLEETPAGNIIRGWEVDGKPLMYRRNQDDRESLRLFSYSSYDTYVEKNNNERLRQPGNYGAPLQRGDSNVSTSFSGDGRQGGQLQKKRRKNYDDYGNEEGDY